MASLTVTLKAATTLDGKIATRTGHSKWITGEAARNAGHALRSQNDAILVGINTVLQDNPQLTTRGIPGGASPIRIVLDSQCRIPSDSLCLNNDGCLCLVVVGSESPESKIQALQNDHIHILKAPTPQPQIKWLLPKLSRYKITRLLVEGGSQIHASFIQAHLADHLVLFMAGKIIGGNDAFSWCGDLECLQLDEAPRLNIQSLQKIGEDIVINADFIKE